MELQGSRAIVTGASRGLGVHIARALATEGVHLALAARSAGALEEVRDEMRALGVEAVAIPTDLAEPDRVEALASDAERELGPVDILVNNAGVEATAPFEEYPADGIATAVKVNLLGTMLLTRAVLPGMLSRGRGHVVNVASLAGKIGFPCQTPYAATKAGLVMFTHSLRSELAGRPVGASVVCPGFVSGDGMYARLEDTEEPTPRLLKPTTPGKVAAAVTRAIRRDAAEVVVNPLPMRPVFALRELASRFTPHFHRVIGLTGFARRVSASLAGGADGSREGNGKENPGDPIAREGL